MPVESGSAISDLDPTQPPDAEAVKFGAAYFRRLKTILKTTFPNFTGAMDRSHTQLNLFEKAGANIASASTTDIGVATGNFIHITGTTTINSFGTIAAGAERTVVFDGSLTIAASANILLPGSASIFARAGDIATLRSEGAGVWRLVNYHYADARSVASDTKLIWGLTYARNGSDTSNDIDIAAGGCMDATGAYWIALAAITKRLDAAWAVGTGNGGLDTGAVANSEYFLWAIGRTDGTANDALFSLSATAPTMPSGYTFKRLIGWIKRVGGANLNFVTYELSGGGLEYHHSVPTLDLDLANTLTTSVTNSVVKVPIGLSVEALINVLVSDNSAAFIALIYCPDEAAQVASLTAASLGILNMSDAGKPQVGNFRIRTNTSGQIAAVATLATVDIYRVVTIGWILSRR